MSKFHAPKWELVARVDKDTGEVIGVVDRVNRQVKRFTTPAGFYNKTRTSNAVGLFYEHWVAYILEASKTSNSGVNCPDVQLSSRDPNKQHLLFEVKAWHRLGGVLLKKNQCNLFSMLGNCYYVIVFHQSKDTQKRWDAWKAEKKAIRKELETPSSLFIVPAWFMQALYLKHIQRQQPMAHYKHLDEYCIRITESHMRTAFLGQETDIPKIMDDSEQTHILSFELNLDNNKSQPFSIIRI